MNKIKLSLKRKKNIIRIILLLIFINLFTNCSAINFIKYKRDIKKVTVNNVDLQKVKDGEFIGEYNVHNIVKVIVSVTIIDHIITNIKILKHKNVKGKKAEIIPERVIATQSIKVDTVTGATNSSKVILKAIENSLKKGL